MIRCITIGTITIQGHYVSEGVVRVGGKTYRGRMVPTLRTPRPQAT